MFGSVPHLEGVLQDGDELLDLAIVQHPGWNPALGSKTLQEIYPLSPLPVLGSFHWSHLPISERDWELVLRHEVKGALGQPVIDSGENIILLVDNEIGW